MDRNQSKPMPNVARPQPNQIGPVLFGSVDPKRPVKTGLSAVFSTQSKLYCIVNKSNSVILFTPCEQLLAAVLLKD